MCLVSGGKDGDHVLSVCLFAASVWPCQLIADCADWECSTNTSFTFSVTPLVAGISYKVDRPPLQ